MSKLLDKSEKDYSLGYIDGCIERLIKYREQLEKENYDCIFERLYDVGITLTGFAERLNNFLELKSSFNS